MEVTITVHCNSCNRDARMKIKLGVSKKELEGEYPCIHCGVKGKLTHLVT